MPLTNVYAADPLMDNSNMYDLGGGGTGTAGGLDLYSMGLMGADQSRVKEPESMILSLTKLRMLRNVTQMGLSTLDLNAMDLDMGRANSFTQIKVIMMGNGRTTRWQAREYYTIPILKWFMMGIGTMINTMELVLNIIRM